MATAAATPTAPSPWVVVGLIVVVFLSAIDGTIVANAMPKVIQAIGGMELYPWAFSAFMLSSTIVTPFYGKFADLYGVRRCMFVAIFLFLLGSALCGAATTMLQMVLFRALQGLGAGGTVTLTFIAFGVLFSAERRGKAQGLISMVWGLSTLLGPMLGGLMVSHFPWPWIFWINLPVGLFATALIYARYPRHEGPARAHAIDWLAAALLVVGLTGVMVALMAREGWVLLGWPVGLAALVGFVWRQGRAADPLVPLSPFKSRLFAVSTTLGFGSTFTMFATLNYMPLFVQGALGRSAPEAALVLTPMTVAWPIAGGLAGALVNRLGFRKLVGVGAVLMAVGYGLLAWPAYKDTLWLLAAQGAVLGFGMGLITATSLVSAQVSVPPRQIGVASSTLSLFRNVGASLGLNLLGGLQLGVFAQGLAASGLSATERAALQNPQAALTASGAQAVPPAAWEVFREALAHSVHLIFAVSAGIALVLVIAAWLMPGLTPKAAAERAQQG